VVAINAAKRLAWYRRQFADGIRPALDAIQQELAQDAGSLGTPPVGASL
jgi:hypothetical protein